MILVLLEEFSIECQKKKMRNGFGVTPQLIVSETVGYNDHNFAFFSKVLNGTKIT